VPTPAAPPPGALPGSWHEAVCGCQDWQEMTPLGLAAAYLPCGPACPNWLYAQDTARALGITLAPRPEDA
jgi:hypothetical protein